MLYVQYCSIEVHESWGMISNVLWWGSDYSFARENPLVSMRNYKAWSARFHLL